VENFHQFYFFILRFFFSLFFWFGLEMENVFLQCGGNAAVSIAIANCNLQLKMLIVELSSFVSHENEEMEMENWKKINLKVGYIFNDMFIMIAIMMMMSNG